MKLKIIFLLGVGVVVGCATNQPTPPVVQIEWKQPQVANIQPSMETKAVFKLKNYDGPEAMDQNEVIAAARECIKVRLQPKITYLSVRTDHGKLQVPVSVMCENFPNQNILN